MAAQNATISTLNAALKTRWTQKKISTLLYSDCPLLGLIPKDTKFGGKNRVIAVRYAGQQGRSQAFSTALNNRTSSQQVAFTLTRQHDYAIGGMDGETVRASKGEENSLIDGIDSEMDTCMSSLKRSLCVGIYGNGGGSIGQVNGTAPAAQQFVLTDQSQIVNFEVGQTIEASSTDGTSGARRGAPDQAVVSAVDRDTGTVTYTGAITGFAANDYLFIQDDFALKITGLGAWVPKVAPTNTPFFGVDRTPDKTRLGGIRYPDNAGGAIEETLLKFSARAYQHNSNPESVFMNPTNFEQLVLALGSKTIYVNSKSPDMPSVGYEGVKIAGQNGNMKVYSDPSCPIGLAYALQLDTWTLASLGAAPGFLEEDGFAILRDSAADAYLWRLGYYAQMYTNAPGKNAVITL